ncbi:MULTISPECIES: YybH family protein [Pseudomonas]|uniref:Ketosteroid isomerase, putative n=2 Tax=Pseudomonas chlororaphis TaxID=587753 RepID=A0AAD1E8V9_9PSED|nr:MULTISPECIES: nuclear transport factor 2 family protein [Pseudomonas]AIC21706.1 ketosteroid isomerase [Pseudomonas chlororaphis]AZD87903.1 Ketosteroid isomerase, putative [Pseudomonas chlororaphis subsp. aureofaciens]AZD94326.1 Ketosteroid isomerase, putative [Pseudomonas chlororaphis subsp. aureofaciens]AZE00631.1 Ketosteroid isomerase, putative [Pseudomonas chlororaphis subsp. aureofaciens]AZE06745.1 Ketosteroid isomerase, putative [Pseudomonas chlororaphis subsp. aureofaciens]
MNAQTTESEIRSLIDAWRQAVMVKDIDRIVSYYADDITSFDAVTALQFKGKEAYRAHWKACMEVCPGPGIFDFEQLHIVGANDIAFAHWLAHCGGTDDKGETKACWMRVTAGYQRIGGQWKVVHEHWSAPFDMMSGTALFDLQP